jgi:hypothetical protein
MINEAERGYKAKQGVRSNCNFQRLFHQLSITEAML